MDTVEGCSEQSAPDPSCHESPVAPSPAWGSAVGRGRHALSGGHAKRRKVQARAAVGIQVKCVRSGVARGEACSRF